MPGTTSEVITDRFTTIPAANALIALVADRVFPSKPAQNAVLPFVVWWLTSGDGAKTLSGRSRLQQYDLRVEAVATTEAESAAVLDTVRILLDGWQDRLAGIQGCFAAEDVDQQTLDDGSEIAGQTFRLHYIPQ